MKIAVDGTPLVFPYNGTWRFCLEVVRGLKAYGHEVTVVTPWYIDPDTWPKDLDSATLIGNEPRKSGKLSTWRRLWWETWYFPRLSRRYDLAIAPYFSWSGIASRVGLVLCVLDVWPIRVQLGWRHAIRKWLLRQSAMHAWRILTISDFSRREIYSLFGTPSDTVYLGADSVRDVVPLHERHRRIMYVGGYEPRKDVGFLVQAISAVRISWPAGTELVLVGAVPAPLRSAFDDLGINVQFVHQLDDDALRQMYSQSRVFVYPSRYEGFGLPPVEAMAHGTPVVVRSVSSLPEVVAGGGRVVSSEDPAEFGRAVVELLEDDDLWWHYQARAKRRAEELTWASCHASLNALIDRWVLGHASGDRS